MGCKLRGEGIKDTEDLLAWWDMVLLNQNDEPPTELKFILFYNEANEHPLLEHDMRRYHMWEAHIVDEKGRAIRSYEWLKARGIESLELRKQRQVFNDTYHGIGKGFVASGSPSTLKDCKFGGEG